MFEENVGDCTCRPLAVLTGTSAAADDDGRLRPRRVDEQYGQRHDGGPRRHAAVGHGHRQLVAVEHGASQVGGHRDGAEVGVDVE